VKQFFNEKEVTSTLVMDALYSGCRQLEEGTRKWLQVSVQTVGVWVRDSLVGGMARRAWMV
jgi:hypothetical protein